MKGADDGAGIDKGAADGPDGIKQGGSPRWGRGDHTRKMRMHN